MGNKLKEVCREEPGDKSECKHYWLIESAGGPVSRGICKLCGMEREFLNSWSASKYAEKNSRVFELPDMLEEKPESEPEEISADL